MVRNVLAANESADPPSDLARNVRRVLCCTRDKWIVNDSDADSNCGAHRGSNVLSTGELCCRVRDDRPNQQRTERHIHAEFPRPICAQDRICRECPGRRDHPTWLRLPPT